ncbi:hypothetical protein [Terrabacter carboxydivorans]
MLTYFAATGTRGSGEVAGTPEPSNEYGGAAGKSFPSVVASS